jgi:SAM-dependent methyltransferase
MASIEQGVAEHYAAYDVLANIRRGLSEMGLDPNAITPDVLKPVDEFHIGGADATAALLAKLDFKTGLNVLDIGCGIGGPARTIALRTGATVTGIDLTPDFIAAAKALSRMAGMGDKVQFETASATALPFPDASFDGATMLHVGMNIPDKAAVFAEAARVLKPGSVFAVYDVMRTGEGALEFPVPWAERAELSALETPAHYRACASGAGFTQEAEENRGAIALDFFAHVQVQASSAAPSPLGLHLLMGPTVRQKSANMIAAIRSGTIAPVQMIFRHS